MIQSGHPEFPTVHLVHGSDNERALEEQLLELFARYDLSKWLYADTVNIEDGVIPHSHPVLTLSPITWSTKYLDNPEQLLHAYVHEQLHHFSLLIDPKRRSETFHTDIRLRYPDLPIERPEGCGSEQSNYIHVEVNFLEYQSLQELLGVERATDLVANFPYYTAIYALVLQDYDELEALFRENHYVLPEKPPEPKRFSKG